MNKSSIVIGILARDCMKHLEANLFRVEELGKSFQEYHIVVYENDSKDGTKECIQEWASRNPHVVAICENLQQITIPSQSENVAIPLKSEWRISKMAHFRNRILEEVRKRFTPDLFCFIDIDVESFSPTAVIEAIENAPDDWGALCANGHLYYAKKDGSSYPSNLQYDNYAFFPLGSEPEKMGIFALSHRWNLISAWMAENLVRTHDYAACLSAFNGLAVYRWDVMKDLQYSVLCPAELKKYSAAICEHVPFHMGIINKGYQVYIASHMEVVYFHKKSTPMRYFRNWYDMIRAKRYSKIFLRNRDSENPRS